MKYVVLWRENKPEQLFSETICESEESVATTIQNLQIDSQTMCKIKRELKIKVVPYFEAGQMALNTKTLQTRIVRYANHYDGILDVYNHDNPYEAELQQNGYMPIISESWKIDDCIPVDFKKAREEHCFQFGTEMGVNPKYREAQICELKSWSV